MEGLVCAFLDARKHEVYAALFRNEGGHLSRLTEDLVVPARCIMDIVREKAGRERCLFVGDGVESHKQLIAETLGSQGDVSGTDAPLTVAAAVARLGEERLRRDDVDRAETLRPLYLRSAEAQLRWRDAV
jgi:tRNA threonylcarbamoyladenosine biosynthesis protein TsaB